MAREVVFLGGSGLPGVEIDLDALESIGRPYAVERPLMPGGQPGTRHTAWPRSPETSLAAGSAAIEAPPAKPTKAARTKQPTRATVTSVTIEPSAEPGETTDIAALEPEEEPDAAPASPEAGELDAETLALTPPRPETRGAAPAEAEAIVALPSPPPTGIEEEGMSTVKSATRGDVTPASLPLAAPPKPGESVSTAHRLSLSRALAVRAFLIEQDVKSTRIDVLALGVADSGPPERVDIVYLER